MRGVNIPVNKENFKQLIVNDSIISESENSVVMSENDVFKLVSAFNEWLKNNVVREETNISVSVGTDASGISDETKVTVFKSLSYNKTEIFDCGKTFVPALFKSIANLNTTGAIYISSVSADSEKYKIEFITILGHLTRENLVEVVDLIDETEVDVSNIETECKSDSNLKFYAEMLRQRFCSHVNSTDYSRPLRGLKFVVYTGGGVSDFFIDKVILPLGAEVVEVKNSDLIYKECKNVSANIGIKFNYDANGFQLISNEFGELTKESLTALMSSLFDEETTILTNFKITSKLKQYASEQYNVSFEYDEDEAYSLAKKQTLLIENGVNCSLAISEDGYCSFSDNNFLIDAVYAAYKLILKIISLRSEKKTIEDILFDFYNIENQWKIYVNSFDKEGYIRTILTAYEGFSLKNSVFKTIADETSVRNIAENYSVELRNENNEFLIVSIKTENKEIVYNLLETTYDFLEKFKSINLDEIKYVF